MRSISGYLAPRAAILLLGVFSIVAMEAQPPRDSTFQGTLVAVDPEGHILTARSSEGQELYFGYADDTRIVGPTKDVQALAGKVGTVLKITYHVEGATNRATVIEVIPASPPPPGWIRA